MPGQEIARLSQEHARLSARWTTCAGAQAELRTAEELCLEALAKDIDAIDLIDGAIAAREKFRRDLFWLLVALRSPGKGATLLAHTPDARPALAAWTTMVLDAAAELGWRAAVHLWNEPQPGWKPSTESGGGWGPPHDAAWFGELAQLPVAVLIRIAGTGADHLFGLEAGLHRFHGVAGEAAHVWVDALEPRAYQIEELAPIAKKLGMKTYDELLDQEWLAMPGPPSPRAARGTPMREVDVHGDAVVVDGDEVGVPWREAGKRLPELAVPRVLAALAKPDTDALWSWAHPLEEVEMTLRMAKAEAEE